MNTITYTCNLRIKLQGLGLPVKRFMFENVLFVFYLTYGSAVQQQSNLCLGGTEIHSTSQI